MQLRNDDNRFGSCYRIYFLRLDLKEERDTDLQNKLRYSMETMLCPIFWQSF